MENYKEIYKSICRVCLHYDNVRNMVSLIDDNSEDGISVYGKAVSTFANVIIRKEDIYPSYMCPKCVYLLKQAIQFKLIAESSDKCLNQLLNISNNSKDLKEKIVEYTMLKFYFPNTFEGLQNTKKVTNDESCSLNSKKCDESDSETFNGNPNINKLNSVIKREPSIEQEVNSDIELLDDMEKLNDPNEPNIFTMMRKPYKPKQKETKIKKQLCLKQQYSQAKQKRAIQKKKYVKSRSYICNICNKSLANRLTLDQHLQRHNGFRYICEQCGKGYPVLHQLQVHQVSSHGIGPHIQCPQCPFKAPTKSDLIEHERIHTGERPYTCEHCGLTFRRRKIWRKHLHYHGDKKVQCPHCPKKFYLRSEMLAHANNIHKRVYVYSCNVCSATYTTTASVRLHLTKRHGIPREMQGKVLRVNKEASSRKSKFASSL